MSELVISGLLITTGMLSAGVGFAGAAHRLQVARRVYRRTEALNAALLGGWDSWFLGGFADMTLGTQWLSAIAGGLIWTLAGLCLVALGIRFVALV